MTRTVHTLACLKQPQALLLDTVTELPSEEVIDIVLGIRLPTSN